MTDCRTIDPLATPYVDGELATAERLLVFDHLRECASCRWRVAAEQSARDALRAGKIGRQRAPDSLRARCAALVQAPPAEASSWPIGPGVDERVARPRARLWRLGVGRRPEVAGAVAQSGA